MTKFNQRRWNYDGTMKIFDFENQKANSRSIAINEKKGEQEGQINNI